MKIVPIIEKIEFSNLENKTKKIFHEKISVGDLVSVIYYDLEKEQIRLQQFTGYCVKFKPKGFNTKLYLRNSFNQISIEQQFFLYSRSVLDVNILKIAEN